MTRVTWADLRDGRVDLSRLEERVGWLGSQPGPDPRGPVPPDRRPPVTVLDFLHGITKEGSEHAMTLRAIAGWMESHPEADVDSVHLDEFTGKQLSCYGVRSAEDLVARARSIGGCWSKEADDFGLFRLRQEIVPGVFYELVANREDVCERVQVGEEMVTEPDPVAVQELPRVERVVPVYEWRCEPILGRA